MLHRLLTPGLMRKKTELLQMQHFKVLIMQVSLLHGSEKRKIKNSSGEEETWELGFSE